MARIEGVLRFLIRGTKPASQSFAGSKPGSQSQGNGDGVIKAFEVVFTPIILALIGVFIDYRLNTAPIFTLGLLVFGVVGMAIKLWYHTFAVGISSEFLQSGQSSTRVIRRSHIKPLGEGDLLGANLEIPSDLDLSLDGTSVGERILELNKEEGQ